MYRPSRKRLLIGGLLVLALLCVAPQADARCWGCGGWGGYYGGWGGWDGYGWGCYGCGGWGGWYAPYYSGCYSSCCGYGSCGYSSCGYSSCGYSSCGSGSCGYGSSSCSSCAPTAPVITPSPANPPTPVTPTPVLPSAPGPIPKSTGTSSENSVSLTVWVPYDAKVLINGRETSSTGSRRQFYSTGLQPGLTYTYVIRAQVVRNNQPQEDTRTVSLTAGQITAVAFGFNAAPQVATAQ